ncbi:hypothetical protein E2542_SST17823 [Spatholobus suberectus]|nr:hypothetical protein E2542_SST17823 [Spatholobus suberectus]
MALQGIAKGLSKGAKVNGHDSSINSSRLNVGTNYRSLIPNSIHCNNGIGLHIPVHAFGFGVDHDATAMHSISKISGGTFSFIELILHLVTYNQSLRYMLLVCSLVHVYMLCTLSSNLSCTYGMIFLVNYVLQNESAI